MFRPALPGAKVFCNVLQVLGSFRLDAANDSSLDERQSGDDQHRYWGRLATRPRDHGTEPTMFDTKWSAATDESPGVPDHRPMRDSR